MRRERKFLARASVLLMALLALTGLVQNGFAAETSAEPVCYEHGDVNGDGKVDSRDAIHLLYHSYNQEDPYYAVNQSTDINKDETFDTKDAIHILYSTFDMFGEQYKLDGHIHQYYAPVWTWNEDNTAQVSVKCGCGEVISYTGENGVVVTEAVTPATCTDLGSAVYTAKVTLDGEELTSTKSVEIPATGHNMNATVCEGGKCSACDYEETGKGHTWVEDAEKSREATCQLAGMQAYKCANCDETKSVELEGLAEHAYVASVTEEALGTCGTKKVYTWKCASCDAQLNPKEEVYYSHSYTAKLTKEATCSAEGEKTYTCSACGDSYTEEVPADPNAHKWSTENNVDYVCEVEGCNATKTVAAVTSNDAISKDALTNADEIQIEGAALALDEDTVNALDADRDIKLDVSTLNAAQTGMTDTDLLAQIGDNKVYDFNMVYADNGEKVSDFAGSVTVSLPYVLQEGDDVDAIDVWFIKDDGTVEVVQGTYSNGFVTFETDHFSYYTVTRLTPAQRCAKYGHVMQTLHKDATCTSEGYDIAKCRRCAHVEKDEILPKLAHDYEETVTAATCTTDGSINKTCKNCKQAISGVIPALGHDWVVETTAATCTTGGKEVEYCKREDCTEKHEKEAPALGHSYEEVVTAATCTTNGWTTYTCSACAHTYNDNETAATGHSYQAAWAWDETTLSATVTLTCDHDATHQKVLNAVVTEAPAAACSAEVTYQAVAKFNDAEYTDSYTAKRGDVLHTPSEWMTDENNHYHVCSICEAKFDSVSHSWGTETVVTKPDCVNAGTGTVVCTICGYEKATQIAATGSHSFADGKCSVCGFEENTCKHTKSVERHLNLDDYGICDGADVFYLGCECGAVNWNLLYDLNCNMQYLDEGVTDTLVDGTVVTFYQTAICVDCGLTAQYGYYSNFSEEDCYTEDYRVSRLSLNGEVIAEVSALEWAQMHPTEYQNTVDLAELGMCEGYAENYVCPCGDRTYTYFRSGCSWNHNEETGTSTCSTCGTVRSYAYTSSKDPETCIQTETDSYSFTKDGVEIYSYASTWLYESHNYVAKSYTMDGTSCEDGVNASFECQDCGDSYESYMTWHSTQVKQTVIDLSDKDICHDEIVQYECACGLRKNFTLNGDAYCSWNWVSSEDGAEISQCATCNTVRTQTWFYGEENDRCQWPYIHSYTFADASGNVLATAEEVELRTNHDYIYEMTLKDGSLGCDGGYTVIQKCQKCDYTSEWGSGYSGHYTRTIKHEYYTDEKMCGVIHLEIRACACGKYQDTYSYWVDNSCSFYSDHYDEALNTWVDKCQDCGIERYRTDHYENLDDPCLEKRVYTFHFLRDGAEVFTIDEVDVYDDHAYIYEQTLIEGAADCDGGYTVTQKCQNCDYSSEWGSGYSGHNTRTIKHEYYTDEKMCGVIDLQIRACACGKYQRTEWYWDGDSCNFSSDEYDDELDTWIYTCQNCEIQYYSTGKHVPMEDPCLRKWVDTYHFTRDGKEVFTFQRTTVNDDHDVIYQMTLKDESLGCEGGYTVTQKCQNCDYSSEWGEYTGHSTRTIKHEYYTDEKMCGVIDLQIRACACGKYQSTEWYWEEDSCNFSSDEYDDELDTWIYTCQNCEIQYYVTGEYVPTEDPCLRKRVDTYHFTRDGKEVFTFQRTTVNDDHDDIYQMTLKDESLGCEGGYTVTQKCQNCDYSSDYGEYTGHDYWNTWAVKHEYYTDEKMCGVIDLVTCVCACGDYQRTEWNWEDDSCNFSSDEYIDELDTWIYKCQNCEIQYYVTGKYVPTENPCMRKRVDTYHFTRNGEEVFTFDRVSVNEEHDYLYTFQLNEGATDCYGGYSYVAKCADCEASYSNTGCYGCGVESISREVAYSDDAMCGDVYFYVRSCACGLNADGVLRDQCSWKDIADSDGYDWDQCNSCGFYRRGGSGSYNTEMKPNSCEGIETATCTYSKDQVELIQIEMQAPTYSHSWICEYDLQGDTCDDGYYRSLTCAHCDRTRTDNSLYTGCSTNRVAYYALADYGMCGGYLEHYSCACRENQYYNRGENCNWYNTGKTNAEGLKESHCLNCDTYRYMEDTYAFDSETCREVGKLTCQFVRDGETVLSVKMESSNKSHRYQVQSFTLDNPDGDCENGYTVTMKCKYCDESYENSGAGHGTYCVEYIDLKELNADLCGGTIRRYSCACGKETRVEYSFDCDMQRTYYSHEEGQDGYTHYIYKYGCTECEMTYISDSFTSYDYDNCKYTDHYDYTFYYGDTLILDYAYENTNETHNHQVESVRLRDGSADCDDGVIVTYQCTRCGDESESWTSGHYKVSQPDPVKLDAVCETYLTHYVCACEQYENYQITGDTKCDFDYQWSEDWVENAVDDWQYTTHGWRDTYSDFYNLICAVTHPEACGYKARHATYWLVDENCMATEYQNWQWGYDKDTQTYANTVTIETGNKHAYHDYVCEDTTVTNGDGSYVNVYTYTCSKCGSGYVDKYHRATDGSETKREHEAINTLDNGENKRYYYTYEYNYVLDGYRYQTLNRYEYTYADGTTSWSQTTYEYQFDEGCYRTYTHTDSNGYYHTYKETWHDEVGETEWIRNRTCTQFGVYKNIYTCRRCDSFTSEYTYRQDPSAHNWCAVYGDNNVDVLYYYCYDCGLESVNGASGTIVLEDMTEDYGNDTNYVVGYWNRGSDLDTRKYVSVIMDEAAVGVDPEIILDVEMAELTEGNDGINAFSFNQADTLAAAQAALAAKGYTGSYAIRFTFVPKDAEDTLDYAITFDSLSMSE